MEGHIQDLEDEIKELTPNTNRTMDKERNIKRSGLWNKIHSIIRQIPREEVNGDAIDAPSAATEVENIVLQALQESPNEGELTDKEIWEFLKTIKYQKEDGDQEYTMVFECDLPKILKAFQKQLTQPPNQTNK